MMIDTERDNMHLKTPQRAGLLWKEEAFDGSVTVVIPFGTARFRVLQSIVYEMSLPEDIMRGIRPIKPRLVRLRSSGAEVWRQMNGYRTIKEITAHICRFYNCSYATTINEVISFCEEAHRIGIINIDFPQPPREGYVRALLADLEQERYFSIFGDPEIKANVIKAILAYGEMIGDEYCG